MKKLPNLLIVHKADLDEQQCDELCRLKEFLGNVALSLDFGDEVVILTQAVDLVWSGDKVKKPLPFLRVYTADPRKKEVLKSKLGGIGCDVEYIMVDEFVSGGS